MEHHRGVQSPQKFCHAYSVITVKEDAARSNDNTATVTVAQVLVRSNGWVGKEGRPFGLCEGPRK
jgi:hypothetical protein